MSFLDDLVELTLGELDLGGRAVVVEQSGAHGDGDLVQVADLFEDVLGRLAQAGETALLGEGAPVAEHQLLRRQASCQRQRLVARATRQRAAVGNSVVVPRLVGEPEVPDVLDAVEHDLAGHVEPTAVVLEVAMGWTISSRTGVSLSGWGGSGVAQEVAEKREELRRLFDAGRLLASMTTHVVPRARAASEDDRVLTTMYYECRRAPSGECRS